MLGKGSFVGASERSTVVPAPLILALGDPYGRDLKQLCKMMHLCGQMPNE